MAEIERRIAMTWATIGKLGKILRNKKKRINLKRKAFNTSILRLMTYVKETMSLTNRYTNPLIATQGVIERKSWVLV